jgi:Negative regulator of sigma E activity
MKGNNIRERISAFMDGNLPEDDVQTLLVELRDEENLKIWDEYHRIGDVLRDGENTAETSPDLTKRILAALENEPALQGATRDRAATNEKSYPFTYRAWAMAAAIVIALATGWMMSSLVGQQESSQQLIVNVSNDQMTPSPSTTLISDDIDLTNPRFLPAPFIADEEKIAPASLIPLDYLLTHEEFSPSVRLWTGTNVFQRFNNWGGKETDAGE